MTTTQPAIEIEYPESDGKPMGETDIHRAWMIRIYDLLKHRYRGQRVYVASDLLLYFEEGYPSRNVVPDDFVVLDSDPEFRRTFLTWKEGRVPNVVFEVTSRWTRRDDEVFKIKIYEEMGVRELILYDPTADYLKPPLKGFRLDEDQMYAPIEPNATGQVESLELGLRLALEGRDLVFFDAQTGQRQLTEAEAEREGREEERRGREQEREARQREAEARQLETEARHREAEARQREQAARLLAEQRASDAEAEVERLKAELARLREQKKP